ncbi:hypothetical protein FD05_GL000951 [Lentilactobacillus otakiensis DSM 19908 = JCM 15040]|uniref:D-alanyl-D-alanine carboxypeptidase n=1 Tax=Lentilactobacillus otakiensis DSM 19908 = JCM 15040 TaxID=1423780 RepID=S4PQW5_9LACO|nr:hypothetical protein [Lentilactobacillus otakiensis]KRL09963.1 hypothetical protein FD05_GL000951 [Lentilactobacillus otakiensis DSM 19908 = JCM 15040]MBZ3776265.1 hypothetical protein [Lentilactobacillus otakiensis]MDV3517311.1 hypothetical protein [Lentilactobacillus otakiensis]GAD17560.1 hypothetical protein LOT_2098 [Lentilactobacillus otakiensis DSM 19908 = JCM 15040]
MKKHTILATSLLTLGLGIGLSTSSQITSAKSSVKIVKTYHMKNALTRYSFNGNIYSSRYLKKVTHKGYNYPNTKWQVNYSVKVKKSNGKAAVYYNIKNGKVKGWIWKGYLSDKPQVKKAAQYKNAGRTINGVKLNANGVAILPTTKHAAATRKLPLSVPVSNKNVRGFAHLNDLRKALIKFHSAYNHASSSIQKDYKMYLDSYTESYEGFITNQYNTNSNATQGFVNKTLKNTRLATKDVLDGK